MPIMCPTGDEINDHMGRARQHVRDIVEQATVNPEELAFWSALDGAIEEIDTWGDE